MQYTIRFPAILIYLTFGIFISISTEAISEASGSTSNSTKEAGRASQKAQDWQQKFREKRAMTNQLEIKRSQLETELPNAAYTNRAKAIDMYHEMQGAAIDRRTTLGEAILTGKKAREKHLKAQKKHEEAAAHHADQLHSGDLANDLHHQMSAKRHDELADQHARDAAKINRKVQQLNQIYKSGGKNLLPPPPYSHSQPPPSYKSTEESPAVSPPPYGR